MLTPLIISFPPALATDAHFPLFTESVPQLILFDVNNG